MHLTLQLIGPQFIPFLKGTVTPQCYGCTKTLASHEHVHHHLIHKHHSFMHKHFYMKHCYETYETCYCSFKFHCMYAL